MSTLFNFSIAGSNPRRVTREETMDIKESISQLSQFGGRAVGKAETVGDSVDEATDAETAMANDAKNANDFDKLKKACLSKVAEGDKALKALQQAADDWNEAITSLEKQIAAEQDAIAQKV